MPDGSCLVGEWTCVPIEAWTLGIRWSFSSVSVPQRKRGRGLDGADAFGNDDREARAATGERAVGGDDLAVGSHAQLHGSEVRNVRRSDGDAGRAGVGEDDVGVAGVSMRRKAHGHTADAGDEKIALGSKSLVNDWSAVHAHWSNRAGEGSVISFQTDVALVSKLAACVE